jgi:hypothetical protein
MIEYYDDKQESFLDDRFYRPAKFNTPDKSPDKLTEQLEQAATNAFNDGFFAGAFLMVAFGLFVWSAWLLF